MSFNKKYLFYNDIVQGAGIGHTLCCYAKGLETAKEMELKFLPTIIRAGQGLEDVELNLGLPDFTKERVNLEAKHPDLIENIDYENGDGLAFCHWSPETFNFFTKRYKEFSKKQPVHLKKNVTNIALSIRRGTSIAIKKKQPNHNFALRLRPDAFYQEAVNEILSNFNIDSYFLHVYSDGCPEDPYTYVNENGEVTSLQQLFPSHYHNAKFYMGGRDSDIAFASLQNCINADFCIGSDSGFGETIRVYREKKNTFLPCFTKDCPFFWRQLCKKFQ